MPTIAEKHAWYLLRDRRTLGLKFRRQVPIDDFIVDFYCASEGIVIELEGDVHDGATPQTYDVTVSAPGATTLPKRLISDKIVFV